MSTYQNSAGSGKAAKFIQANPLGPMADPFAGMVSLTKKLHDWDEYKNDIFSISNTQQ